jgi:hypothetical protein
MLRSTMLLVGAVLLFGGVRSAHAGKDDGPAKEGLVRIYVTDGGGVAVGGDQASVTVELDYGGFKKSLKTDAKASSKKPAAGVDKKDDGKAKTPEGHGGQAVTQDGYVIDMVVEPLDDPPHGASPWFESKAPFVAYQDSMKDTPPAEAPGRCKGCGMTLQVQPAAFNGVVVVKLKDRSVTASGFVFPPADAAKTLGAAAADISQHLDEMDKLVAAGTLEAIHAPADAIAANARLLDRLASDAARPRIAEIRRRLVALWDAIDAAIASGKADDVKKALAGFRTALADLKKQAN